MSSTAAMPLNRFVTLHSSSTYVACYCHPGLSSRKLHRYNPDDAGRAKTLPHRGDDPAGDSRRTHVWIQRHGSNRASQRNGIPGHEAAGAGRPDSIGVGTSIAGRCRAASASPILQAHALRQSHTRGRAQTLSAARRDSRAGGREDMTLQIAILYAARLLVPRAQRPDWFAEWKAELEFVSENAGTAATSFCCGAFRDAIWLRRNSLPSAMPSAVLASPWRCITLLATLAAAAVFLPLRPLVQSATPTPDAFDPGRTALVCFAIGIAMAVLIGCRDAIQRGL